MKHTLTALAMTLPLLLIGCGGDDGESTASSNNGGATTVSCTENQELKDGVCVNINMCTLDKQKSWVRTHLDQVYLWYNEIVDVPRANYDKADTYFEDLLVRTKDNFSHTVPQKVIDDLAQSGLEVGFGATWVNDPSKGNMLRVAFVEANSPAASQGVRRGDYVISVNGKSLGLSVEEGGITNEELHAALSPTTVGVRTTLVLADTELNQRTVTLTSAQVIHKPVANTQILTTNDGAKVGYILFNDHIATATEQLIVSMQQLKAAAVTDLVLDLRYNGGGYLYVAAQLASMIAGDATKNQLFNILNHNNKRSRFNYMYFFESVDANNQPLPMLNLSRVYVLMGAGTCSASEAIINGLSPYIQVITVGDTTCGKPYGYQQANNCETAYFAVSFEGANKNGVSVPTDGLTPTCAVADNLDYALGSTEERLLASALNYRVTGGCSTAPAARIAAKTFFTQPEGSVDMLYRQPWRNNMTVIDTE
ncbi:S41 family peptidase [Agitococcus lubricus]|uniref:C-terminal processing protease CtpA/Prc n=1 Tax=Agitococcus lubricus TaxID=1077255 RepID=A0A2T5IW92_9GAMM|nr:S41 family peptidase [Agitococcus lubricus]PTQ88189.1 C-terminal processing protease CtpA/Prc [Agitococcus lubricus]